MTDLEERVEVLERKDRSDELWARYGIVSELLVDANRRIEVLEDIVNNTIPELHSRIHVLEMQAAARQAENKPPTITAAQVEEVVRDFIEWWNGYGSEYEGRIPKLDVQLYLAHRAEKEEAREFGVRMAARQEAKKEKP